MKWIGEKILTIYVMTCLFAIPYYNWQYAKEHGFLEWLFLGEFVATAKGAAWPFFFATSIEFGARSKSSLREHRATAAGILEVLRLNADHSDLGISMAVMDDGARHEAIEKGETMRELLIVYGEALDVDAANSLYPDLGTRIVGQLVESYRIMNAAIKQRKPEKLREAYEMQADLASWLAPRGDEIIAILRDAVGDE